MGLAAIVFQSDAEHEPAPAAAEGPPTCDASIASIWNPERAAAVREAMLATGIRYAATAVKGVERVLDDYAASWGAALDEVAAERDPTRAKDMCACLRRSRMRTEAMVSKWLTATPKRVEAALLEVESLSRPADCLDPHPRPPSPIPAPIRDQLVRRFDDLHMQHYKGETLDAIAGAKSLYDDVAARGDRWLAADVGAFLGEIYVQLGRFEEAEQVLGAAYEDAGGCPP